MGDGYPCGTVCSMLLNGTLAVDAEDELDDELPALLELLELLLPHAASPIASAPTVTNAHDKRLALMLSSAVCARAADASEPLHAAPKLDI